MHRTIWVSRTLNGWRAWLLQADCRLDINCRLDIKRSLTSFSLASSAKCQTSRIPPKPTQDGIPPTMTSGDGTAVISCPLERWDVPPVNPVHVLFQIWSRPRKWTSAENPLGVLLLVTTTFANNRTRWILSSMSESITWLQWNEVGFFQDPLWALWL